MSLRGTFAGVVIDGEKLAALIREPGGIGIRAALEVAEEVKTVAQDFVGYNDSPYRTSTGPHLRDTIVKRVVEDSGRAVVQVGSEAPHAEFHHEGTDPHVITGNPLLVFFWEREGRVVGFPQVNHPGTTANPFLTDALRHVLGQAISGL